MLITVSQSPVWHPQMSCFIHNPKIFTLLSERTKETRKYSHLRSQNERIWPVFLKKWLKTSIIKIVGVPWTTIKFHVGTQTPICSWSGQKYKTVVSRGSSEAWICKNVQMWKRAWITGKSFSWINKTLRYLHHISCIVPDAKVSVKLQALVSRWELQKDRQWAVSEQ